MKRPELDRRLITILLIVFVQMLGSSMAIPLLPLYAQREFAMPPQTITLLISSFFIAQFLAGPWIGRLSDTRGRLPILIVSQIGTVICFTMLGFAQNIPTLFAARVIDGITGGNIIVAQAYVTDITPRGRRTEALGYILAAFGLGFIFGPALGGALSAFWGVRIPFLVASGGAFIVVLLTWFTLEETLTSEQQMINQNTTRSGIYLTDVLKNYPLVLILVIAFIGQFALGLLQATFALYGEAILFKGYTERTTNLGIGLLLTSFGVFQFITQTFLLRRFLRRWGEYNLVIIGSISRAIGLLIYAIVFSPWLAVFGSTFFAIGMGLMMPSLQSLATSTVSDQLRGGILGLYQSSVSLATIVSTAIAGIIFAANIRSPYWIGMMISIIVIFPVFLLQRQAQNTSMPYIEPKI